MGAINSGRTICGVLFGASVYLGFLNGHGSTDAPAPEDGRRLKAIKSVNELFNEFIARFGDTNCTTLTGCDWSQPEDIQRYFKEEIYKETCYRQFEYAVGKCINLHIS